MSDPKSDCSVLRWLDPKYAAKIEQSCDDHDRPYKYRQGNRLVVDLRWIADAAEQSGEPVKTMLYGFFTLLFGWWLWYDFDEKVRFWR